MKNYKDIENTRYFINRVFADNKTTAMLIEKRVLAEKSRLKPLTADSSMIYNSIGGSIQSREGL